MKEPGMDDLKQFFYFIENGDLGKVIAHLEVNPEHALVRDDREEGDSPLHIAAMAGHKDIVVLLLAKGADINARANLGRTPLHWAAWNGHYEVARILVAHGANVNAKVSGKTTFPISGGGMPKAEIGSTALHYAAYEGHLDICELLLENGADVNAATAEGWTPLHRAKFRGHDEVVELLKRHGGKES
jgi:26S proteasome non-ATPase regulatory subunit 10